MFATLLRRCGCLMLALATQAYADAPPPVVLPRTEVRYVTAAPNGVTYRLQIALPSGYERGAGTYPLILLLDADYSFAIARNVVEHQADRGRLPASVIVGVSYEGPVSMESYRRHRSRDYTPVPSTTDGYGPEYFPVQGGGPAFAAFLAKTVLPLLEHDYRVGATRILVGHSFGGLFGATELVSGTAPWTGYLIVSPSLWYEKGWIYAEEARRARDRKDLPARAYLAVGDREHGDNGDMRTDLKRYAAALEAHKYPSLSLRTEVLDDETHDSVWPRAFSNGIRWLLGEGPSRDDHRQAPR